MLEPYRVLDLTDGRADLAAFVLAGLGADVIKVEPPGGSPARSRSRARSASRPAWPACPSRRSIGVSAASSSTWTSQAGRADFLALVAGADFLIENAGPGVMDRQGLGFDALRSVRPDLVYVALSPFGQTGPYADYLATDLTLAAMGGSMALNGEPDRRPVRITVPQTWLHAAAEAALGALVAHARREATGEAQFVDVSVQAAVFWTGLNAMISHAIDGRDIERNGTVLQLSTLVTPLVYPCADGEVCLVSTSALLVGLVPWMVETGSVSEEWAAGRGLGDLRDPDAHGGRRSRTRFPRCARRSPDSPAASARPSCSKEASPGGSHWRRSTPSPMSSGCGSWRRATTGMSCDCRAVGPSRLPAPSSKRPGHRSSWSRPAPEIGEHTAEVLLDLHPDRYRRPPRATPVASNPVPAANAFRSKGVKVADFSWIGVGPITAKALADHGATVVHVESDNPPDRLRLVGPFKDDVPGINRCQFFGAFNTSKLSLQLNLKHPEGQAVARRLLAWCDIALDSFSAGTMERARSRLRDRPRPQPRDHHGYHVSPRPVRTGGQAGRLRIPRRCHQRLLRDHRMGRPAAGRSLQRLHRHDRAAIPDDRSAGRAGPSPAHRRGSVHRPGPDGIGPALHRAAVPRRRRFPGPAPAATGTSTRRTRLTTSTPAPGSTSGAPSRSRTTTSGGPSGGCWATRRGRPTRSSTRRPGG